MEMTREEAVEFLTKDLQALKNDKNNWDKCPIPEDHPDYFLMSYNIKLINALELSIKALEQGPILDKIRAEIEQITDTMGVSYNQYVSKTEVLLILDRIQKMCLTRSEE